MKKIMILLLGSYLLYACSNQQQADSKNTNENTETRDHQHETVDGLTLNECKKWKADNITNGNVKNLENIIDSFNGRQDESMNAYQKVTAGLQQGLDKMISECRMEGRDHEMLHQWLEPLLEEVQQLKNTATTGQAAKLFTEVEKQVKLYSLYFEWQ
jgi:hypothetical protein